MADNTPEKIRLFHTPLNHRGSTEYVFREAIRDIQWPDYSKIIYIAPTPEKLKDSQKKFHSLVKSPYIPPRFFTLKQISRHLFDTVLPGRYLPKALAHLLISEISGHSIGYSCILSELLMELKQYHPSKDIGLIRHELGGIFKKLGIPEDSLKRLEAALDIFERYNETISVRNFYDDNDILNISRSYVAKVLGNSHVLLADGFYDMTASEMNLFGELIRNADSVLIVSPNNDFFSNSYIDYIKLHFSIREESLEAGSIADLSYVRYSGVEEEIEGIARHIKNLAIIGRLKAEDTVIVTFPHIKNYPELIERVFMRYGLPCSVTAPRTILGKSSIRDVLYLIEAVAEDFPRQKFISAIASPCFRNIPEILRKHIPSLSLRAGIVKGRSSWENLNRLIEDKSLAISLKHDFSRLFGIFENLLKSGDSSDIDVFGSEINTVLAKLGFEAEQDEKKILKDSIGKIGILSELTGKRAVSLRRYAEFLRHLIGANEYRHEDDGIFVMDFLQTRGLEADHLYFCGLKDGEMPSKPPIDHILPDSARTEYGLINLNKYLAIQKLNFLRITGSSANIHLSYPAMDGDNLFLPSPYLTWDREIPENVFGIFSLEELQVREGDIPFSETIREIRLNKKTKEKVIRRELSMPFRVTDIDYFRKCPRRFFIEKILNLEASEIARYEVEAKLLGTVIHRVMEELLKESLYDVLTVRDRASQIFNRIIEEYPLDVYWKRLVRESFIEIIPEIMGLESELRTEGYAPYELELNVREEVLPGISLKGKIDRIDRGGDSYRLIDYKTGAVNIGSEIIKKGKELQIPLYAAMLKARGIAVERAGIYSLKDITIKWIPTTRDSNTLDDYISAALKFLKETVAEIEKGSFEARPLDDFYCSSCAEAPFCPYINSRGIISDERIS
ncbi:MAG: PD-(D/E)XK nuclease family protein [Nitrospirota bacterium]